MSSGLRFLAVEAVALRVLAERVATRLDAVKRELAAELGPGDRTTARLGDGTKVGAVTYTLGRTSARVVDETALAAWVAEHYPSEVVQSVRPAFLRGILDVSRAAGLPMAPDGTADVPGVQVLPGEPYLTVRPDPDAALTVPQWLGTLRANAELALDPRGVSDGPAAADLL